MRLKYGRPYQNRLISLQCKLAKIVTKAHNLVLSVAVNGMFEKISCQDPGNILVFRTGTIGDFVCALPPLSFLRQADLHGFRRGTRWHCPSTETCCFPEKS